MKLYVVAYTARIPEGRVLGIRKAMARSESEAKEKVKAIVTQINHPDAKELQMVCVEAKRMGVVQ